MTRFLSTIGLSGLVASGLLSAGCSPTKAALGDEKGQQGTPDGGGTVSDAEEKAALDKLAESMRSFHKDTTGWPLGDMVWRARLNEGIAEFPQVEPTEFTDNDVALFKTAKFKDPSTSEVSELPTCSDGATDPCWKGPYTLAGLGPNMNDKSMLDRWEHKRLFAYIRPFDGAGGGTSASEEGFIVIWSAGPDGLDQTGCQTTDQGAAKDCSIDYSKLVKGESSTPGSDDIVVLVANSAK
jgi:hypothetical protein